MSEKWKIWVNGYGTFNFEGTEREAEEMRAHKARWEDGQGRKWRVENQKESDRLTERLVDLWDSGKGAPQSLLTQLRKAKQAELS